MTSIVNVVFIADGYGGGHYVGQSIATTTQISPTSFLARAWERVLDKSRYDIVAQGVGYCIHCVGQ